MAVQVTAWLGPFVPFTVAVNCWVFPNVTDSVLGDTVTEVTVGGGAVSVTVAVPEMVFFWTLVAVTVSVVPLEGAV
jgi:hypothetical protein